jgi:hypothetical protein
VLYGLYARAGKPEQFAERESRLLPQAAARFIHFRDKHRELSNRFIDVKYTELVSNPLAVIRQVYRKFEMPLTDLAAERMRRLAGERSRYRKGRTRNAPAEFKFETVSGMECFEEYCARFGIAWRRPQV